MQGRRVYLSDSVRPWDLKSGEYAKGPDGTWWIVPPDYVLGTISKHTITEHEDGTITVSPSILMTAGENDPGWHGFLERGIWRKC